MSVLPAQLLPGAGSSKNEKVNLCRLEFVNLPFAGIKARRVPCLKKYFNNIILRMDGADPVSFSCRVVNKMTGREVRICRYG